MQFLFSVIHDSTELATPSEMAAIGAFNERLHSNDQWIFAQVVTTRVVSRRTSSARLRERGVTAGIVP